MDRSVLRGSVWERIGVVTTTNKEKMFIEALRNLDPKALIYMSVTELADITGVAESTIVRFCQKIDFKGFQDFKLRLSSEIRRNQHDGNHPSSIAEEMCEAVSRTKEEIDYASFLEIATKIVGAKRVFLAAVGNSAVAAMAAKLKLLKAGINIDTSPDPHIQAITVANMDKDDILILVSVSGSTKDILDIAAQAKQRGVTTVAVTNYLRSPLVRFADYVIYNCKKEAPNRGGSFATMVSQAYVIDVLSCAVYDKLGETAYERAERASEAVSDKLI